MNNRPHIETNEDMEAERLPLFIPGNSQWVIEDDHIAPVIGWMRVQHRYYDGYGYIPVLPDAGAYPVWEGEEMLFDSRAEAEAALAKLIEEQSDNT